MWSDHTPKSPNWFQGLSIRPNQMQTNPWIIVRLVCLRTAMKKSVLGQQVLVQHFCFLFLWQDTVIICLSQTWSCTLCFLDCWACLTSWIISLATYFVRFFVYFGQVRNDIFFCAIVLVRKRLTRQSYQFASFRNIFVISKEVCT